MIDNKTKMIAFQDQRVRKVEYNNEWYFSVVDIVVILTENEYQTGRKYWKY